MSKSKEIHAFLLNTSLNFNENLYDLILENGQLNFPLYEVSLLDYLVKSVIGQQLSNKAANSIYSKLQKLISERQITATDFFIEDNFEVAASVGLSKSKVKTIIGLNKAHTSGNLTKEKINDLDEQELKVYLTSFWGVGKWTYQMVSMFYLGNQDLVPTEDTAYRRGLEKVGVNDLNLVKEKFTPYNSILAIHIWSGLDNGII